jgi:hypothetical protein
MKLAAIMQVYNEVGNGNLVRALASMRTFVDDIYIYDDGSTDVPDDLYKKCGCKVTWGIKNDFANETAHKQLLVDRAIEEGATRIWFQDADETIESGQHLFLRDLAQRPYNYAFHFINLWRHSAFYRVDGDWGRGIFNKLWVVPPGGLRFAPGRGLHRTNYPIGATDNERMSDIKIIHWGFASTEAILRKYFLYRSHGQHGWALDRLIDESTLRVLATQPEWIYDVIPAISPNEIFGTPLTKLKATYEKSH